jgi:hypothetical protein
MVATVVLERRATVGAYAPVVRHRVLEVLP